MIDNSILYLILACSTLIFLALRPLSVASKRFIYPPGPRALPLFGNLFEFPTSRWWFKFTELGEKFGILIHLSVAGRHIVVIKSQEIAKELLEGTSTADRPPFVMAGELMGFGISIAFIGYGERWRTYRRISHQVMSITAVQMYHEMQEKEARRLVHAFVKDPQSYREQLRFTVGRTIMDAIYGIDCATPDDTYIKVAEATLDNITHAIIPGSFVVDAVPWLKYLPYIGLPFQKHVRDGRKQVQLMVQRPFQHVLRNRENGTAKPSFTSSLLDGEIRLRETAERNDIVSWAAATMYGAAGETMLATLLNFILSMAQNPGIQQKAFAEIESVVGRQRCPNFSDQPRLPYVNALIKEVTRWRVVLPLGIPHMCRDDTQYKDYILSKGTILIPNVWSISRDPVYYKDPQVFNPERFLEEGPELDPFGFVFGFGPRTCVGKNFAINQLYIFVASLLWAFEIAPVDNKEIPNPAYSSGFVSAPVPFLCKITPRHSGVEELTKD
ncbi:hypothetical protein D9619_007764 [Psilocybe cf. subviscida]|uniref:Cytochrome P450 n=1 Tax=Psilocybe cf. subviscida TaxID=2480587 RepID=A0A8H5AT41_9AGAR|nr:hypothetical protein D9619_007764 [Psilocybe cf. subviscida]